MTNLIEIFILLSEFGCPATFCARIEKLDDPTDVDSNDLGDLMQIMEGGGRLEICIALEYLPVYQIFRPNHFFLSLITFFASFLFVFTHLP